MKIKNYDRLYYIIRKALNKIDPLKLNAIVGEDEMDIEVEDITNKLLGKKLILNGVFEAINNTLNHYFNPYAPFDEDSKKITKLILEYAKKDYKNYIILLGTDGIFYKIKFFFIFIKFNFFT